MALIKNFLKLPHKVYKVVGAPKWTELKFIDQNVSRALWFTCSRETVWELLTVDRCFTWRPCGSTGGPQWSGSGPLGRGPHCWTAWRCAGWHVVPPWRCYTRRSSPSCGWWSWCHVTRGVVKDPSKPVSCSCTSHRLLCKVIFIFVEQAQSTWK